MGIPLLDVVRETIDAPPAVVGDDAGAVAAAPARQSKAAAAARGE